MAPKKAAPKKAAPKKAAPKTSSFVDHLYDSLAEEWISQFRLEEPHVSESPKESRLAPLSYLKQWTRILDFLKARFIKMAPAKIQIRDRKKIVMLFVAILALTLSLFYKDLLSAIGVPMRTPGYLSIGLLDPIAVQNGVIPGELIGVDIHNGFETKHEVTWKIISDGVVLDSGTYLAPALSDRRFYISTQGASPAIPIEIHLPGINPLVVPIV